jgi:hypothetical protein
MADSPIADPLSSYKRTLVVKVNNTVKLVGEHKVDIASLGVIVASTFALTARIKDA